MHEVATTPCKARMHELSSVNTSASLRTACCSWPVTSEAASEQTEAHTMLMHAYAGTCFPDVHANCNVLQKKTCNGHYGLVWPDATHGMYTHAAAGVHCAGYLGASPACITPTPQMTTPQPPARSGCQKWLPEVETVHRHVCSCCMQSCGTVHSPPHAMLLMAPAAALCWCCEMWVA